MKFDTFFLFDVNEQRFEIESTEIGIEKGYFPFIYAYEWEIPGAIMGLFHWKLSGLGQ